MSSRFSERITQNMEIEKAFQIIAFSLLHWSDGCVWVFLVILSILFGSRIHNFRKLIKLRVKNPDFF